MRRYAPLVPLNESRFWKPLPSVLMLKMCLAVGAAIVVIPYRVEPTERQIAMGIAPLVPLNESRFWKPLPSVLMLKMLPSLLAPPPESSHTGLSR